MSNAICPDCGQPLPANAPGGLCPTCLLRLAALDIATAEGGPTPPEAEKHPVTGFPRYKLIEIIGEGGFGTVWMAEQLEPVRRQVGQAPTGGALDVAVTGSRAFVACGDLGLWEVDISDPRHPRPTGRYGADVRKR